MDAGRDQIEDSRDFVRSLVGEYLADVGFDKRSNLRPFTCWSTGEMSLSDLVQFSHLNTNSLTHPEQVNYMPSDMRERFTYSVLKVAGFRNHFEIAERLRYPTNLIEECCASLTYGKRLASISFKGVRYYAGWKDDDVKLRGIWRLFRYFDNVSNYLFSLAERCVNCHREMNKDVSELERWINRPSTPNFIKKAGPPEVDGTTQEG